MNTFFLIFLFAFAIVLLFGVLPFVFLLAMSIVGSGAPFVPVPKRAVPGIVQALALSPGAVVYDMGCGDGRILLGCTTAVEGVRGKGIECALLPFLLAKIRTKGQRIEIRRANFFSEDLAHATHVVLYLFPGMMEKIAQKFARELKGNVRVVAIDFPFPELTPKSIVTQDIPGLKRGTTLYIYDETSFYHTLP